MQLVRLDMDGSIRVPLTHGAYLLGATDDPALLSEEPKTDHSARMCPYALVTRLCCCSLVWATLGCSSPESNAIAPDNVMAGSEGPSASANRPPPTEQVIPDAQAAEAELLKLEQDYATALIKKDRAFLMRFYAPDWRGGNWMGFWTKSTMLNAVLDERYVVESMTLRDVKVRVLGRIAIVQGHDDEVTSVNGRDTSGKWTFTDVFEHRDGMWVAIASHTAEAKPGE
jgi:hypothetical protein